MIGEATTGELSPTGSNGDKFDVFLSLRDGAGGEEFSSGIDDIGEEATAGVNEAAGKLDLVAVASGEKKLPPTEEVYASIGQTACVTCVGCPFLSQCIKPQALAVKQESESQDKPSDDMSYAGEEAVPNLMEITPKQSYLERLLAPDDFNSLDENGRGELVMAGYSEPTDYQESITKKAPEPVVAEAKKPIDLATKTDEPTEQIVQQERETKTSTNQAVEASGEDVDTEAAETPFFGLKMAPETIADDIKDVGEALSESTRNVLSDIFGEEHFTEPTEENRPSIEIKQQTFDVISGAADKKNQQPAFESPDILMQTKTRTVPSSPVVSEDAQTGDKSCNSLENETVYPTASEDKVAASVVENTYDGDENTAPSSLKTPSIERQEEKDFVITGSESANFEPSRVAEKSKDAIPVSEQQHLAAQFEAVRVDESAAKELIDNSGTKASIDAQPSELNIDVALDYDNFVESTDGVDVEQSKCATPTATNMPPSQAQEDAVNVSAEYETNETSTEKMVNATASIPAKEQPDQPAIVPLSTQDIVEYGESLLSVGKECTVDRSPTRPDVINKPTTHEVIEATHEANEMVELDAMNVTLPAAAVAVSEGKSQIDLPPELSEELVVDQRIYEAQTFPAEQLDYNHAAVECDYGKDDGVWAEEDMVFFVEQQSPVVEPGVSSSEVVTVAPSTEAVALRKETDDLESPVDDEIGVDMESAGQLDNFKTSSVPEITNDYEPVEQIAITTSLATEPIPDVELDEPAVEILEERIMPHEERDNMTVKTSEKSDLPPLDDEVETIIADTSDVEPTIDLLEAQEELAATEVSEAVEPEAGKQTDLAVVSVVDGYGYNSETSAVSDNVLVVKSCQPPGLWPDDSRLNPEEESASTAQSSADDASLVSRLVGMFVVAMCVVRGRQARAIPNS